MGNQGYTGVYRSIQCIQRVYRGNQGSTDVNKSIQG